MAPPDDGPPVPAVAIDPRFLAAALESAPDGIVALAADGRILLHNRRFLELWGLPSEPLTGRTWDDLALALAARLIDPIEADNLIRPHLGEEGASLDLELRDGRVFRWQDAALLDGGDGTLGRIWFFRDITVRHRVEAALRESEARSRAIHDTVADGIITTDGRGVIQSANPAASRLFGYAADEMAGRVVTELMRPDDGRELVQRLAKHADGEAPLVIGRDREVRGRRRDGSLFPMVIAISEMVIGAERLFTGIFRDMSQERAADAALRLSIERFRDYARATSDWFWETDRDLRFRFFSDRFREVTGEDPARLLGKTRFEVGSATPDDRAWKRHVDDLLHHRPFSDFTYVYRRGDGQLRVFRISGTPVFDVLGVFGGYRGVGTDITGMVEAEKAHAAAERRFTALAEGSQQGVLVHRDFKPLYANPAYARILGYESVAEVMAQPSILPVVAPEMQEAARENYRRLIDGEPPPPAQRVRNIRRNGAEAWLDLVERRVDWQGQAAVQATVLDVSEQVRLARDLARRTAELDSLIRNLAAARGAV